MKRFWSLIIAVVMLFTVFALVSCEGGKTTPTEEATTTVEPTTAAPTTAAPTTAEPTTAAPTTAEPTTAAPTTAEPTTAEPTTAEPTTAEPTTAEPTEATTTEATTKATGTTLPLYARFDFGTESYAVQNNLTAHQYLLDILHYNDAYLYIQYFKDSWKIWVMADYVDGTSSEAYMMQFDSVITYDYEFDDEGMLPGWGTWSKYPYTTANVGKSWVGAHQYMKIRLINNTTNNMMGLHWAAANNPTYFTTFYCSNLYLQGDVGKNTCTATTKYASYTYDLAFTNALASNRFGWSPSNVTLADGTTKGQESWCNTATYAEFVAAAQDPRNIGLIGANNYLAQGAELSGIKFFFFGAVDDVNYENTDSRKNAKQGSWIEIDYIIFGSTTEQIDTYKSNLERAEEAKA